MPESIPPLLPFELEELSADGPPPPDAQARVRAKLGAAIPHMQSHGGGGPSGAPPGWRAGIAWPMATFVLGGVVGAALAVSLERPPPPPPPRVVYVERSAQAPALGSREPPRTEVAGATIGNATPVAGPTTNATATSNGCTSAGSPLQAQRSQLEAERRVLDGARAALVAELPDRALEQIAMHRARFQKPLLAEERDALEIQALVRTGRSGEARDRARAFHERWPESLFDFAVDSAIASIP